MTDNLGWYYFGCGNESGHYLFSDTKGKIHGRYGTVEERLRKFDGSLPPYPENANLYKASFVVLTGLGYCALSWWDRSVDKRPASNSTVFAPLSEYYPSGPVEAALHVMAGDMLADIHKHFPWVINRLPQPLELFA